MGDLNRKPLYLTDYQGSSLFFVDAVEVHFESNVTNTICEGYDCNYRYGFQGQEKDDEIKGRGNSVNYTFRMHDPRLGRFFAIDPLAPDYPYYTPYQFSGNRTIDNKELEGLEPVDTDYSNAPEGTSSGTTSSFSNYKVSSGAYLASKKTFGSLSGSNFSAYSGFSASNMNLMNGTGTEAGTTFGSAQVGFSANTDFGGRPVTFGISHSQTLNQHSSNSRFSEFNNTIGSITFNIGHKKAGNLGITWANDTDIMTHKSDYTDRGLTNYFRLEYTNPSGNLSVALQSAMYTPQRQGGPNGDGTGAFHDGGFKVNPGGRLFNNGLYDVNSFAGDFAHHATLTITKRTPKLSISISAGMNDSSSGQAIQGTAHGVFLDPPVPEFPWPEFRNGIIGVSLRKTLSSD